MRTDLAIQSWSQRLACCTSHTFTEECMCAPTFYEVGEEKKNADGSKGRTAKREKKGLYGKTSVKVPWIGFLFVLRGKCFSVGSLILIFSSVTHRRDLGIWEDSKPHPVTYKWKVKPIRNKILPFFNEKHCFHLFFSKFFLAALGLFSLIGPLCFIAS